MRLFVGILLFVFNAAVVLATPPTPVTPSPTPTVPNACQTAIRVTALSSSVGQGELPACVDVEVDGDCCWQPLIGGTDSGPVQCGSGRYCYDAPDCDCPGCHYSNLSITVAGVSSDPFECSNYTPTPTNTKTIIPTPSRTPSPLTPIPTSISTPMPCTGDCDEDLFVSVDELVRSVSIALGDRLLDDCIRIDADNNGAVTIDELVRAVDLALTGCPSGPTLDQTCDIPATSGIPPYFCLIESITTCINEGTCQIADLVRLISGGVPRLITMSITPCRQCDLGCGPLSDLWINVQLGNADVAELTSDETIDKLIPEGVIVLSHHVEFIRDAVCAGCSCPAEGSPKFSVVVTSSDVPRMQQVGWYVDQAR